MLIKWEDLNLKQSENIKLESKKKAGLWISKKVKEKADLDFILKCVVNKSMVLANQLDSGGYVDIDNLKKYYFFISASNHLIEKKYSKKVRKATNGLTSIFSLLLVLLIVGGVAYLSKEFKD